MNETNAKEEKVSFKHATASKIPRFEMVPRAAFLRLVERFELGHREHGEKAWNGIQNPEALTDRDWIIARVAHVIDHAYKYLDKLQGGADNGDDDAAAIMWGGMCLAEAQKHHFGIAPLAAKAKRGRPKKDVGGEQVNNAKPEPKIEPASVADEPIDIGVLAGGFGPSNN